MKPRIGWLGLLVLPLALQNCTVQDNGIGAVPTQPGAGNITIELAFPGKTGTLKEGTLYGAPIRYEEIEGRAVFQGDIILSAEQLKQVRGAEKSSSTGRTDPAVRWPNNVVYYAIDVSLPNQARVTSAIAHWEANSLMRFVVWTNQPGHPNYITFRPGAGCSSPVGMPNGHDYIDLHPLCDAGSVIHEIGHTIGLWHEHTRSDQTSNIIVNWSNIRPEVVQNFQTYTQQGFDGFDLGATDYGSIMIYPSLISDPAFVYNPSIPVLTRLNGTTWPGQRTALSTGDKAGAEIGRAHV